MGFYFSDSESELMEYVYLYYGRLIMAFKD
jgi:hypothetical protein